MGFSDWFGGGSEQPPEIGEAARNVTRLGQEQLEFNRAEYDANKLKLAGIDRTNSQIQQNQLTSSQNALDRSNSEWDRYKNTFAPVQDKMAQDAMNIDSDANLEKAAGEAGGKVKNSFANAQAQKSQQLASMGIDPSSGRATSSMNETAMQAAAVEAGAMNNARDVVKDRGISIRSGVSSIGNSVASGASSLSGQSANIGNSAAVVGNMSFENGIRNTGVMNSGYDRSINANKTTADMYNKMYENDQQAASSNGQMWGTVIGAGIAAFSSKKLKEDKQPMDDTKTLDNLKKTPVGSWKYKKGVADEGRHVGAYAEDMQKNFGDELAPGGNKMDIISAIGVNMSATRGVAKQVDSLEVKVNKLVLEMQRGA